MEKLRPEEWLKKHLYEGMVVVDPDGWDRQNFETSWNEPIDEIEFKRRLFNSSVLYNRS